MKGRWTWLYDVKSVISASRQPKSRVIQPWMSNNKTLPTQNPGGSAHNTPVLVDKGEGVLAATSAPGRNQVLGHLQPEQLLSRFQEAAGLHPYTPQSARLRAATRTTSA